jgi:hypothetical protein
MSSVPVFSIRRSPDRPLSEPEKQVLEVIAAFPSVCGGNFNAWARELNWFRRGGADIGRAYGKRVARIIDRLHKRKLVYKNHDRWYVTKQGKALMLAIYHQDELAVAKNRDKILSRT